MKINNFRGELTDISAKEEALYEWPAEYSASPYIDSGIVRSKAGHMLTF